MSNYIKAVKTVATATAAEIVDLIDTDDVAHITSSGATDLQFVYRAATGATTASNIAVTVLIPAGSSTAANLAAAQRAVVEAQQNPGSMPYLFEYGINGSAPQLITSIAVDAIAI
tara:strand:+ start:379 stop:723 length:345 start_codon:yes stop_codon:yes gene_type:complete